MKNIIENENEMYGFYSVIRAYLKDILERYLNDYNYSEAESIIELIELLDKYKDSDNILMISDNNGMGYTVSELIKKA